MKELKDFKRIILKPGESRDVTFVITADKLKFYNAALEYVCEPGDFEVMVGPDSNNLHKAEFRLL